MPPYSFAPVVEAGRQKRQSRLKDDWTNQ